ncbi:MAG: acyltransferase, partial [bacterium]|nr:acyltransferase [bacterium]
LKRLKKQGEWSGLTALQSKPNVLMNLAYLAISMVPSDKIRGEIISIIEKMYARNELNTEDLEELTKDEYYDKLKDILNIASMEGKIQNKVLEAVAQLFNIPFDILKKFNTSIIGEKIKETGSAFEDLLVPLTRGRRATQTLAKSDKALLKNKRVMVPRRGSIFQEKDFKTSASFSILKSENIITANNKLARDLNTAKLSKKIQALQDQYPIKLADIENVLLEEISLDEYAKLKLEEKGETLSSEDSIYDYLNILGIDGDNNKNNATLVEREGAFTLCLGENIVDSLGLSMLSFNDFNISKFDFLIFHEIYEYFQEVEYSLSDTDAHKAVLEDAYHQVYFQEIFDDLENTSENLAWQKIAKYYRDKQENMQSQNIWGNGETKEETKEETLTKSMLINDGKLNLFLWKYLKNDSFGNMIVYYNDHGKRVTLKKYIESNFNDKDLKKILGDIFNKYHFDIDQSDASDPFFLRIVEQFNPLVFFIIYQEVLIYYYKDTFQDIKNSTFFLDNRYQFLRDLKLFHREFDQLNNRYNAIINIYLLSHSKLTIKENTEIKNHSVREARDWKFKIYPQVKRIFEYKDPNKITILLNEVFSEYLKDKAKLVSKKYTLLSKKYTLLNDQETKNREEIPLLEEKNSVENTMSYENNSTWEYNIRGSILSSSLLGKPILKSNKDSQANKNINNNHNNKITPKQYILGIIDKSTGVFSQEVKIFNMLIVITMIYKVITYGVIGISMIIISQLFPPMSFLFILWLLIGGIVLVIGFLKVRKKAFIFEYRNFNNCFMYIYKLLMKPLDVSLPDSERFISKLKQVKGFFIEFSILILGASAVFSSLGMPFYPILISAILIVSAIGVYFFLKKQRSMVNNFSRAIIKISVLHNSYISYIFTTIILITMSLVVSIPTITILMLILLAIFVILLAWLGVNAYLFLKEIGKADLDFNIFQDEFLEDTLVNNMYAFHNNSHSSNDFIPYPSRSFGYQDLNNMELKTDKTFGFLAIVLGAGLLNQLENMNNAMIQKIFDVALLGLIFKQYYGDKIAEVGEKEALKKEHYIEKEDIFILDIFKLIFTYMGESSPHDSLIADINIGDSYSTLFQKLIFDSPYLLNAFVELQFELDKKKAAYMDDIDLEMTIMEMIMDFSNVLFDEKETIVNKLDFESEIMKMVFSSFGYKKIINKVFEDVFSTDTLSTKPFESSLSIAPFSGGAAFLSARSGQVFELFSDEKELAEDKLKIAKQEHEYLQKHKLPGLLAPENEDKELQEVANLINEVNNQNSDFNFKLYRLAAKSIDSLLVVDLNNFLDIISAKEQDLQGETVQVAFFTKTSLKVLKFLYQVVKEETTKEGITPKSQIPAYSKKIIRNFITGILYHEVSELKDGNHENALKTSGIEQKFLYEKMLLINKSLHDEKALKNVLRNLYQEYQNYQAITSDTQDTKVAFFNKEEVMGDKNQMITFIPPTNIRYFFTQHLSDADIVQKYFKMSQDYHALPKLLQALFITFELKVAIAYFKKAGNWKYQTYRSLDLLKIAKKEVMDSLNIETEEGKLLLSLAIIRSFEDEEVASGQYSIFDLRLAGKKLEAYLMKNMHEEHTRVSTKKMNFFTKFFPRASAVLINNQTRKSHSLVFAINNEIYSTIKDKVDSDHLVARDIFLLGDLLGDNKINQALLGYSNVYYAPSKAIIAEILASEDLELLEEVERLRFAGKLEIAFSNGPDLISDFLISGFENKLYEIEKAHSILKGTAFAAVDNSQKVAKSLNYIFKVLVQGRLRELKAEKSEHLKKEEVENIKQIKILYEDLLRNDKESESITQITYDSLLSEPRSLDKEILTEEAFVVSEKFISYKYSYGENGISIREKLAGAQGETIAVNILLPAVSFQVEVGLLLNVKLAMKKIETTINESLRKGISTYKGNNIVEVLFAFLPYFLATSLEEEEVVKQKNLYFAEFFGQAA